MSQLEVGGATGIWREEARHIAKHPTNTGQPPKQTTDQPKMSTVLVRNTDLEVRIVDHTIDDLRKHLKITECVLENVKGSEIYKAC